VCERDTGTYIQNKYIINYRTKSNHLTSYIQSLLSAYQTIICFVINVHILATQLLVTGIISLEQTKVCYYPPTFIFPFLLLLSLSFYSLKHTH